MNTAMANITDTGIKGFLKWLQVDNPGFYAKVAPEIAHRVPAAFSTYEQSKDHRLRRGGLGADITQSSPGLVDISFDPLQLTPITPVQQLSDGSDVSDVANAGSSTPTITSIISNIVGAVGSVWMTKQQLDTQQKITDIQLQRAQAGLPPLPIDTSRLGIPQVSVGIAPQTQSLLMWGGLGLLAVLAVGAMSKGRR